MKSYRLKNHLKNLLKILRQQELSTLFILGFSLPLLLNILVNYFNIRSTLTPLSLELVIYSPSLLLALFFFRLHQYLLLFKYTVELKEEGIALTSSESVFTAYKDIDTAIVFYHTRFILNTTSKNKIKLILIEPEQREQLINSLIANQIKVQFRPIAIS